MSSPEHLIISEVSEDVPERNTGEDEKVRQRIDPETRLYTDEDGREWTTKEHLSKGILGISSSTLNKYIEQHNVESRPGFDNKNSATTLYPVNGFNELHETFLALPRVDPESGIYTDVEGKEWVAQTTAADQLGIPRRVIIDTLSKHQVASIVGRDRGGKVVRLYEFLPLMAFVRASIEGKEKLPQVDSETGVYVDHEANEWITVSKAVAIFGTSIAFIQKVTESQKIRTVAGRDQSGRSTTLYNLQELYEIMGGRSNLPRTAKDGIYVDSAGKRWAALFTVYELLHLSSTALKPQIQRDELQRLRGISRGGKETDLYCLDEIESLLAGRETIPLVENHGAGIYRDDNGKEWAGINEASRLLGVSEMFIITRIGKENIPFLEARAGLNRRLKLYGLEELRHFSEQVTALPQVEQESETYTDPQGLVWCTINKISKSSPHSGAFIKRLAEDENIPSIMGRGVGGKTVQLYQLSALTDAIASIDELPNPYRTGAFYTDESGKEWASLAQLSRKLNVSNQTLIRLVEHNNIQYLQGITGRARTGKLYPVSELEALVRAKEQLPNVDPKTGIYTDDNNERWATASTLSQLHAIDQITATKYAKRYDVPTQKGTDRKKKIVDLYSVDSFEERAFRELEDIRIRRERKETHQDPEEYLRELFENEPNRLQKYRELISIFGASHAVDILYFWDTTSSSFPPHRLKSTLAQYLGDYTFVRPPVSFELLSKNLDLLKSKSLREGLTEVIKHDCLQFYLRKKREDAGARDLDVINEYFDQVLHKLSESSAELDEILANVETYYHSIFGEIAKPDQLVDALSPERAFPDAYQRINMQEIKDKQRLLIADEMGAGKSASVILAKEALNVQTALVVVPSNVIPTWKSYLSSIINPEGKQVGYFKQGKEPDVLVIESAEDLKRLQTEIFEYVIISHERLTDETAITLQDLDYDMLIVDEIHKLKNLKEGERANNLLPLAGKTEGHDRYLALLSGTPIPNKVQDLAMLLKLLHPDRFRDVDSTVLVSSIIHGSIPEIRGLLVPYMQMKNLGEHVEMPRLTERVREVNLSPKERDVYEVLLEEDELTAAEKIQVLRKFLLNPRLLEVAPDHPLSKIETLQECVDEIFASKDKAIVFVNDYVDNVIVGSMPIIRELAVPEDIEVSVIHGGISSEDREAIQYEFQHGPGRKLLFVSGQTADVGVDFSSSDHIVFYNEPWTRSAVRQQTARVYRPGVKHDMEIETLIAPGTIEEGIHEYIEIKHQAIEKILRGVPITELEQQIVQRAEQSDGGALEVNPELAAYYFSSFDKLNKIFASVKEMGEEGFKEFLQKHGSRYAECYLDIGARSYQANASRIAATLIDRMIKDRQSASNSNEPEKILDLASGPEMLARHALPPIASNTFSIDINAHHFQKSETGRAAVGSFMQLPYPDGAFENVNLALALHYTQYSPAKGIYERAELFKEINRILATGGKAVITMIHSLDLKDYDHFQEIISAFGFDVVPQYSGMVASGTIFSGRVVTLEKRHNLPEPVADIMEVLTTEQKNGLKITRRESRLRDQRKIATYFTLGESVYQTALNEADTQLLSEEGKILDEMRDLTHMHQTVQNIPSSALVAHDMVRILVKNKYILFKKMLNGGVVVNR